MQRILITFCALWSTSLLAAEPMRIVSAGASVTEILFALGHGGDIVATDSTSLYPPAAASLTKLGYFRQLSTEGVIAQHPTHLLGAAATGPDSAMAQLTTAGVEVIKYQQPRTIQGLVDLIAAIGEDINAQDNARNLIQMVKADVEAVLTTHKAARVVNSKALYIVANNERGLTVAGSNTLPDALFSELGMQNIAAKLKEYKLMSNESVMQANPDVIFVASHHGMNQAAIEALCAHPAIAMTNAGKHCAIEALSSATSLGLSPRIAETLASIVNATVAARKSVSE